MNKYFEYASTSRSGEGPWHSTFLAIYFTLTGLHGLHIIGGIVVMAVLPRAGRQAVEDEPGAVHEPRSSTPASTGTSSTWCGSSCSRAVPVVAADRGLLSPRGAVSNAFRSGKHQEERSQLPDGRRGAARVHGDHRGGQSGASRGAAGDHRRAVIAAIKGSMVARVHAPEPREAVDLRRAAADGGGLHRADLRAAVHHHGRHRHRPTQASAHASRSTRAH